MVLPYARLTPSSEMSASRFPSGGASAGAGASGARRQPDSAEKNDSGLDECRKGEPSSSRQNEPVPPGVAAGLAGASSASTGMPGFNTPCLLSTAILMR